MPTLYGSWQGSGYQARLKCTYTRTYPTSHEYATFDCSFAVEFGGSISDSTNDWAVTGPGVTDSSGTNVSYSIASGGGSKTLYNPANFNSHSDLDIDMVVGGINAVGGGDITATFTLPVGDLAPYFVDDVYSAGSITAGGFTGSGWSSSGNGGTLNNLQTQYNTSASATGATTVTRGSYAGSHVITGLTPNTLYYFRVRQSNNTYGYGAWGPWVSFTTAAGTPGAPPTTWSLTNITADGAEVTGATPSNNGGSAITSYRAWYALVDDIFSYIGYFDSTAPAFPALTGLNPGTKYYVWVVASNANGDGDLSVSKSFTTLLGSNVKVGGIYKPAVSYVKVGGVYKTAVRYIKVGGVYKQ